MKKSLVLAAACSSLLILGGGTASSAVVPQSSPALSALSGALGSVTAYSATITVFEQSGIKVQNMIFKYTYRRPSTVTTDVVGGPNNGVSMLWTGGTTVSAHKGGVAGVVKKTFSLHDPTVTTIRGSSIDQLSFPAILAHAEQTPGKLSQAPGMVVNDDATDAVSLIPASTNAGYTREVVEISRATHLPSRVLGYEGTKVVRRIDFVDVKITN
jgi:outer membrane lipoprotein-sorting protein